MSFAEASQLDQQQEGMVFDDEISYGAPKIDMGSEASHSYMISEKPRNMNSEFGGNFLGSSFNESCKDDMMSLRTANIEKVDYISNLFAGVQGLTALADNL